MSKQPKIPVSEKISKALLEGALPVAAVTMAADQTTARAHQVQVSSLDSMSFSLKKTTPKDPQATPNISDHQRESLARLEFRKKGGLKLSKQKSLMDKQISAETADDRQKGSRNSVKVLNFNNRISPSTKTTTSTPALTPDSNEPEDK